ncbi:MAG TPA: hypothetical protein VEQ42_10620 [Pyrinomonadaceae bacterium]|nr:hypothetical protein [Pyrinomonadaceae bacterium]
MRLRSLFLVLAFAAPAPALAQEVPAQVSGANVRPDGRRDSAPAVPPELSDTTLTTAATPEAASPSEPRPEEARVRVAPVPTPLPLAASADAHHVAYAEAFRILSADNECSRFFGGAAAAVEVLNRTVERMRPRPLPEPSTCVKMRGQYTVIKNTQTGAVFRVFDEVTVNSEGPVSHAPSRAARRMAVGSFPAHTKPGWVLILLHEVGHLVQKEGGGWLLPNDGDDARLSQLNTKRVEANCLKQLNALRD